MPTLAATVRQPRPKARVHGEVRGLPWSHGGLGWGLPLWTEVPVCGAGQPGWPAGLVVTGLLATNADSPRGCPAEGAPHALPVKAASWLCRAGNLLGCCQAGPLLAPRPVSQAAGQPLRDCSLLGSQWEVGLGQAPPSPGLEQATPTAVDRTWVAACDLSGQSARAMAQKWGVTQLGQGERTAQSALETEDVALPWRTSWPEVRPGPGARGALPRGSGLRSWCLPAGPPLARTRLRHTQSAPHVSRCWK